VRRVARHPIDPGAQEDLGVRQAAVARKCNAPGFSAADEWKAARPTATLGAVLTSLRRMMGDRQRCMYCLDSHGTDIEHFWPKTPYPERMFVWLNLLLCCAECGRFKGDRFPLADGMPLLVDPTAEDPWQHLDFDPTTGNIVARFDVEQDRYSTKGVETVKLLQLDQREAMASGYKKTLRRLSRVVNEVLGQGNPDAATLIAELRDADDHGLLAWCFHGSGRNEAPFCDLRERHPNVWATCAAAFA
jgi:uncharacterized protein (TIGR02646 family)